MNLQDIKDLMKEFNDSDIYKLSLEMDDVKLKLEKEEPIQPIVAAPSAIMPTPAAAAPTVAPAATPEASACEQQEGTPVKSPVVGVFLQRQCTRCAGLCASRRQGSKRSNIVYY